MNIKELNKVLGENPKTNRLLIALLEIASRNQAILDTMSKDHNEMMSAIRNTSLDEQNKTFSEKSEKTYLEVKADIVSFIL